MTGEKVKPKCSVCDEPFGEACPICHGFHCDECGYSQGADE